MNKEQGIYARASEKLREKLYLLKGQWFYKEDACAICGVRNTNGHQPYKDAIGQVLYNWSHTLKEPILEQRDKKYWVIESEFKVVKPNAIQNARYDLKWPKGIDDNSQFGFPETTVVTQGDVMGLGGEGNRGKSLLALNLAIENCGTHPVTLILSENAHRLDERLSHVDWTNIFTEEGDWKFEVIEETREERYLDIVRARKDNLVIIDWVDASKDSYLIGQFYRSVAERLGTGVAFIIQQKRSYKDWAVGGEAARDYSSVFLLLKANTLIVDKVKVYDYFDPNGKMYHFDIQKHGSRFGNIFEIYNCPQCKGKKTYQGSTCGRCYGKGYLESMGEE